MKKTLKILVALLSITLIILSSNSVLAIENLNDYDPSPTFDDSQSFLDKAAPVLGFIRIAGMLVGVVTLAIIGLKYMVTSVQEKADYKKQMLPFIVGCFMLMGVSVLLGVIESLNL